MTVDSCNGIEFNFEPTLACAVTMGRAFTGQSMRRLARSSGISAGQISRIEAGQVKRPGAETLLALGAALNHHPTPMQVLGGKLTGKSARRALGELIDQMIAGTKKTNEPDVRDDLKDLKKELSSASAEQLRQTAISLLTYSSREVLWPDRVARSVPASLPDHDLLGRLIDDWTEITPERRWRLVQLADDLRAVSQAEHATNMHPHGKEDR